jgi:hypothetical protein
MRKPLIALTLATTLAGACATVAQAQPMPEPGIIYGVDTPDARPALDPVQFFWAGHNYCWYDGGWHGPGWYWCGYPWRSGWGWGGPFGWHGWHGGVRYGWRDGHYYGHDRRWRGEGWHEHGRHGHGRGHGYGHDDR